MWLKLLKQPSLKDMMTSGINHKGHRTYPMINGRQKRCLKRYFEVAGVPWIYQKNPRGEVHFKSPYNRSPKPTLRERAEPERIQKIRDNLATMDDRLEKLRFENAEKKGYTGLNFVVAGMLKSLQSASSGSKGSNKKNRAAERIAEKTEMESIGVTGPKRL